MAPQPTQPRSPRPEWETPVSIGEIHTLLMSMLRCRFVRVETRTYLPPAAFDRAGESYLELLASTVYALDAKYGDDRERLPYSTVVNTLNREVDRPGCALDDDQILLLLATPEDCDPDDPADIPGLVYRAYKTIDPDDVDPDAAIDIMKRFLNERVVTGPLRKALAGAGDGSVANLPELLELASRQTERIHAIGDDFSSSWEPDEGESFYVDKFTTGIPEINAMMGGGQAGGELYGLLAATGQGKSTFFTQLALNGAKYFQGRSPNSQDWATAYLFSYEDSKKRISSRAYGCAANIRVDSVEAVKNTKTWEGLSRRGHLKPYERDLFAGAPDMDKVDGEYERLMRVLKVYARNFAILDMTKEGRGEGGVDEIVSIINREIETKGRKPGVVFIDSIDLLAANFLSGRNEFNKDSITPTIMAMIRGIRRKVSVRYNIPVWLTNQVAGAETGRSAGRAFHHSNAANGKSWANALDFHLSLSTLSDDKIAMLSCSKSRRTGGAGMSNLMRLDGGFGRWLSADSDYAMESGRIIKRETLREIGGDVATKPKSPKTTYEDFGDFPGFSS